VNSEEYKQFAYVTREDLNFLTSSSKIKPPFVIVEAPESTRVDYFIPKMTGIQTSKKERGQIKEDFHSHMNDYRIIMESNQKIKMFMAEEKENE
jgi:hypothetical protein